MKWVAMIFLALFMAGCGVRNAQVATQTSLTGVAEAVDAGSNALAKVMPLLREKAVAETREQCTASPCEDPVAVYVEKMAPVDRAIDGLEVTRESLSALQGAQDVWVASGNLPDTAPLCQSLGDAVNAVPPLLDECGVDVPEVLQGAGAAVTVVCEMFARWRSQ